MAGIAEELWDEAEDWPPEAIAELVAQAVGDYQTGKFSRDFVDKLADRGIPLQTVIRTVTNQSSLIVAYADRRDASSRVGFWHPRLKIFVAWKPGPDSRYLTCFWRGDGLAYAQRLLDSRPIRRPRSVSEREES